MKNTIGPAASEAIISQSCMMFVKFINVGKTMTADQVQETSRLIQTYFPHLNLADMKVFFERMKIGHYGKFYDRIDGQIILEKLDQYNSERMDQVENESIAKHRDVKKEEKNLEYAPNVIAAIKSIIAEKRSFSEERVTKFKSPSIHQRWMRQFDNLHAGNKDKGRIYAFNSGVRSIKISGKLFTVETFLQKKIDNLNQKFDN